MMRVRSDRVRRSSEPMKINKVLVHHSDRDMLPVDDDPTQTPRIRNPDFLHSDHILPPEPGHKPAWAQFASRCQLRVGEAQPGAGPCSARQENSAARHDVQYWRRGAAALL